MVSSSSSDESPTADSSAGVVRGLLNGPALIQRLLNPIDIASLVIFRIVFGFILFWHVWLQVRNLHQAYIDPVFHYTYPGFGWVEPLPGQLMYVVFLAMAACAILIAFGLFYRYATIGFFLLHTYVLLIDQSTAWNHYYLISLLAFLMIFIPANRTLSGDVARGAVAQSDEVPSWCLWILRGQMGLVYFYAGLAKLSSHDWLHARPMDIYLTANQHFPLIGGWFDERWLQYAASYAGMLFDLSIVPLMLWRRSRPLGLALAIVFHLSNSLMFNIQVFPYLALAATLLFLGPSWPRLGDQWRRLSEPVASALRSAPRLTTRQTALFSLLGVFFLIQLLLPLRHFAFRGNAEWTKLGGYHAWRMLLDVREVEVAFFVTSEDPKAICEVDLSAYLYPNQVNWLGYPDGAVQFARYIAKQYRERGASNFEINVWSNIKFNGREGRALYDMDADLASVSRPIGSADWLIPLDKAVPIERPTAERCPDPAPLIRLRQLDDAGVDLNDVPQLD
jgi:vitamin K-dependent gamma-carboxylase